MSKRSLFNFNSTMVRLKGLAYGKVHDIYRYFNSTMVRLKVLRALYVDTGWAIFQFHYGTIKSIITLHAQGDRLSISIPLWYD